MRVSAPSSIGATLRRQGLTDALAPGDGETVVDMELSEMNGTRRPTAAGGPPLYTS